MRFFEATDLHPIVLDNLHFLATTSFFFCSSLPTPKRRKKSWKKEGKKIKMPTLLRGRDTGQSSAPSGFIVVAIAVPAIFLVFATFSCLLAYTRRKRWRQPYPAGGAPLRRQQWGGGDDGPERPPPYSGPVGVRMPERVYGGEGGAVRHYSRARVWSS